MMRVQGRNENGGNEKWQNIENSAELLHREKH